MPKPAIHTKQLTKSYGSRTGIKAIDLQVPRGSVFGFIGPNGAGKTTTIRVLLGFLRPDGGQCEVLGLDCSRQSHAIKAATGYVPGDLRLPTWMKGTDALLIHGRARGINLQRRGHDLAELFDLDLNIKVRAMSRGMRQKLGLILALAHDPDLLILDEPTTALDPITQAQLYRDLRRRADGGATVFFSSHVLSEVEDLCDQVAIIRKGSIVADQTIESLIKEARRLVTLRWNQEPQEDAPSCLIDVEKSQLEWTAQLDGDTTELLNWLQGKPLADMVLARPDLDSLFLRYYLEDAEGEV